jgi:hypothetical protein
MTVVAAGTVANAGLICTTDLMSLFQDYHILGMSIKLHVQRVVDDTVSFISLSLADNAAVAPNATSLVPRIDYMIRPESSSIYNFNWSSNIDYNEIPWTSKSTIPIPSCLNVYASIDCQVLLSGTLYLSLRGYS